MKVFNHRYVSTDTLEAFLKEASLASAQHLLVQCFDGSDRMNLFKEAVPLLKRHLPHALIIGTGTDGEIMDGAAQSGTLCLSFTLFDATALQGRVVSLKNGSFEAGRRLGEAAAAFDAKVMILFSDGIATNGDQLMEGIASTNESVLVAGGMAGDNGALQQTFVAFDDTVYSDSAVAVMLHGDALNATNTFSFNWMPIGPVFEITHSDANRLVTLDGLPAIEIYRAYLGDEVADRLPTVGIEFPLILNIGGHPLGRAPLACHEDGSMTFAGNVPQGTKAQFGIGNIEMILDASNKTPARLAPIAPEGIFAYSCMARRRFLGTSVDIELEPLQRIAPVAGFFTYGEFYSDTSSRQKRLMNETMTLLALSENAPGSPSAELSGIVTAPVEDENSFALTFKALSHLINKTSTELHSLNTELQQRIEDEVAKNREKDKLMIAQSKQATMGEMISMIAHQWRQPITTIGLISNHLMLDAELEQLEGPKVSQYTSMIDEQVHFLSRTIDDFRNFFRPNREPEWFAGSELLSEIKAIVGKSLEHSEIDLESHCTAGRIYTYRSELLQVCLNLVNNAKDAISETSPKKRLIRIGIVHGVDAAEIRISDSGGGISPVVTSRIFEPYFSTKHEKHGTGLGLYMSKTIVEQHLDGELTFENAADGALFTIQLPHPKEQSDA